MDQHKPQYCYIKVAEDSSEDILELPSEDNGMLLLTTLQAQFTGCTGLRYKAEGSNSWRGIRLSNGELSAPPEGWGSSTFHVVYPKASDSSSKRKIIEESPGHKEPEAKIVKTYGRMRDEQNNTQDERLGDLIVLGLPFSSNEADLRTYFQKFGEVDLAEVKRNPSTNRSKGFGFVSFKQENVAEEVLKATHVIGGRQCEVRVPRPKESGRVPFKLFVGRMSDETTEQDLNNYFSQFGELSDVYIPKPFRGFGFVTFATSDAVKDAVSGVHTICGSRVNITYAEPKGYKKESPNLQNMMHMFGNMSSKGNMFNQMYNPAAAAMHGAMQRSFQQGANYARNSQPKYSYTDDGPGNSSGMQPYNGGYGNAGQGQGDSSWN